MKKNTIVLVIIIMVAFVGLGIGYILDSRGTMPEIAMDEMKHIEGYQADVEITLYNDKQELKHFANVTYNKGMGVYTVFNNHLELKVIDNQFYVTDEDKAYLRDGSIEGMLKYSFIHNYYDILNTQEELEYSVKKINKNECLVFEIELTENNRNYETALLYLDMKTYNPIKIELYDMEENMSVKYEYTLYEEGGELPPGFLEVKGSN